MNKLNKFLLVIVSIMLVFTPCYVMANEEIMTIEEQEETTEENNNENNEQNNEESNEQEKEDPKEDETQTQPENKISLNKTEVSLDTGKSITLEAITTPTDAKVKWSSSDDSIAKVDEIGKVTAGNEAGKVTITALIEETDIKATCTINVSRTVSKDATLKDLNITNGKLDPEFKSDLDQYNVIVNSDVSSLNIKYELSDSVNAKYFGPSSSDNKNLKNGDTLEIKVVAEDGITQKTYKLTIIKESTSLSLKTLKINGYALNEIFDSETEEYTASIPYEIETVTIKASAVASDNEVDVKISGTTNLKVGENTVKVVVTDKTDNSKTKTYKIIVTREKEVEVEEKPTSIITSSIIDIDKENKTDNNDKKNNDATSDDFLKYAIVSIACLILFIIGGIGIYFYLKTSPKKLRKELEIKSETEKEDLSPIIETPIITEEKTQSNGNIESIMDEKLVETREFKKEDLTEKTENLFDDE